MTDSTALPGGPIPTEATEATADHSDASRHPKHRRDDVPVDAQPDLGHFGENPDTALAG
jgi:hypothetical protein